MVILRYISSDQLWHYFMIYKEEKAAIRCGGNNYSMSHLILFAEKLPCFYFETTLDFVLKHIGYM